MKFKNSLLSWCVAAAATAGLPSTSFAVQVSMDYDATLAPVVANMFGTGVVPDHFTLGNFTNGTYSVELGLRARYRVRPTQANDGNGVYGPFPTGTQTAAFGSPAHSGRPEWVYDFFVDTGNVPLTEFTFSLCIDGPGGANDCMDPIVPAIDNLPAGTTFGQKGNSWNMMFANTPGNGDYDVNQAGRYDITFSVTDAGGAQFGQVGIAAVVPEPGTLALLGISLAGLAVVRRRKQRG